MQATDSIHLLEISLEHLEVGSRPWVPEWEGLVFLAFSPNSSSRRGDPESTEPSIFIFLDRVKEGWVIRKAAGG